MFNYRFFLTPLAVVRSGKPSRLGGLVNYREIFVFGVRIVYWTEK